MFFSAILASGLAAASLTSASPAVRRQGDVIPSITLQFNTAPATSGEAVYDTRTGVIGELYNATGISASSIKIAPQGSFPNPANVECRSYKDTRGVSVQSTPFTLENEAKLSTNLVDVGSVLCYVVA